MSIELFSPQAEGPLDIERFYWRQGISYIAGVDEAGRGALAGPVVAAAVIFSERAQPLCGRVKDSKLLSPAQREGLFDEIQEYAECIGLGVVEAEEIDKINILRASLKAMKIAMEDLLPIPNLCLIDGNQTVPSKLSQRTFIKGDRRVFSIGAASIIAKVTRDKIMLELADQFPQFSFDKNKGYGTKDHICALRDFGPTPFHRNSFHPKSLSSL